MIDASEKISANALKEEENAGSLLDQAQGIFYEISQTTHGD